MNLRQEIADSIRATIRKEVVAELRIELKEVVAELRTELVDELREQARNEIQEDIEKREEIEMEREETDFIDAVYEEALDDYCDRNRGEIAKDAEKRGAAAIRQIRQECQGSIDEALAKLRQQIGREFDFAVSMLKQELKDQASKLTAEFRDELHRLSRDKLREAIQSVTNDILNTAGPESPELSTPSVATSRPTEPPQTSQPIDPAPSQSQNSRETFRRAFGDINRFDIAPETPPAATEAPKRAVSSDSPSQ